MSEASSYTITTPPTGPEAPPPVGDPNRPAWLPENFKTPEDLAKSYKEAQAELTRLKQGIAPPSNDPPPVETPPQETPPTTDDKSKTTNLDIPTDADAAKEAAEANGIDFDKYTDEFMKDGKLSDASYADIEKRGIPRAVVDKFIEYQVKEAEAIKADIVKIGGGEEQVQQMLLWAKDNYADKAAYSTMINSGDVGQMRMAMTALRAAYVAANGSAPSLVQGAGGVPAGDVYKNDHEMLRDMQDPRYFKDPAFQKEVQDKVARSMMRG